MTYLPQRNQKQELACSDDNKWPQHSGKLFLRRTKKSDCCGVWDKSGVSRIAMQPKATRKQDTEKWKRLLQCCQQKEGSADISALAGCVRITKGIQQVLNCSCNVSYLESKAQSDCRTLCAWLGGGAVAGLGSDTVPRQVPTHESKCHSHNIQNQFNINCWLKVV